MPRFFYCYKCPITEEVLSQSGYDNEKKNGKLLHKSSTMLHKSDNLLLAIMWNDLALSRIKWSLVGKIGVGKIGVTSRQLTQL